MSRQTKFPTVLLFHVMQNSDGYRIIPTYSIDQNVDEHGELLLPLEAEDAPMSTCSLKDSHDEFRFEIERMRMFDQESELDSSTDLPALTIITQTPPEERDLAAASWGELWALAHEVKI